MTHSPAESVRLLCLDVDGVMTDGGIALDDRGIETKRFHVRDGFGIKLWIKLGGEIAIITGREGDVVRHRAAELGIRHVIQGSKNKLGDMDALVSELGLQRSETAFLGDDLPDLRAMQACGYPMAVADAVEEVRSAAVFVTTRKGGDAAVREAIEHLVKTRGRWEEALATVK